MRAQAAWWLSLGLLAAMPAFASDAKQNGEAAMSAGKYGEAAEHFEKAVGATPADAAVHHMLAEAYGAQANDSGMITKMRLVGRIRDHYERAVALAPDEVRYRESLLEYYLQAPAAFGGGTDKARAEAAQIAKRDAARGLLAAGRVAQLSGDAETALARYREAHAANPGDARIALRLVIFLQELKRFPEAFQRLDALLAADATVGAGWYQLGRTAVLSNSRHADGEKALRNFIAMPRAAGDPPLEAAHWRLGMLYEQTGRKADARAEYLLALRLNPGHAESKAALKKLG